jgi:L-fuconolactonase
VIEWDGEWLDKGVEAALDPDLPIVDPHHHLWDTQRPYLLPELRADTGGGHRVEATVFVECGWHHRRDGPEELRPVGETEAVATLADASEADGGAAIRAIVGHADMRLGDGVQAVLDAHAVAAGGRLRGIRHSVTHDDEERLGRYNPGSVPHLMADGAFRAGVRRLAASGLSFDAWLFHTQIPELTDLARALPECVFVLDHLGGPLGIGRFGGRRDAVLEGWRVDVAALARCPNVNVKLGGIGMPMFGLRYHVRPEPPSSDDLARDWAGPITYVIEQFGAERCMFESNFPVDKLSCSYVTLWNAFKKMAADASAPERAALFHDTATRVYRL